MIGRREFLSGSAAAGFMGGGAGQSQRELQASGTGSTSYTVEVTIERQQPGQPHKGKVLAAIQPHCDDVAIFAGGTVLKLIDEGYRGVLIQTSNDSMAGSGSSIGDIVFKNERDTNEAARRMGITRLTSSTIPTTTWTAGRSWKCGRGWCFFSAC